MQYLGFYGQRSLLKKERLMRENNSDDSEDWIDRSISEVLPPGNWEKCSHCLSVAGTGYHRAAAEKFVKTVEAGVRFRPDRPPLELRRAPTNSHDPNAVGVWARIVVRQRKLFGDRLIDSFEHIGYVPAEMAAELAERRAGDQLAAMAREWCIRKGDDISDPDTVIVIRFWVMRQVSD